MNLLSFLRNASGEVSQHSAIGRWRQAISQAVDALGPAAPDVPLSRVLYVDGIQSLVGGNGAISTPYATIQEALDFIGPPTSLADEESYWTIYVINGAPPEDLVVPPRRRINISVIGGPTEVNSITWPDTVAAGFGSSGAFLGLTGFKTILTDITVSDGGTATFGTLFLQNIFHAGDIDGTAYLTGTLLIEIDGASVAGHINCPAAALTNVLNAELFGDVTVSFFDFVGMSVLGDPFTVVTWTVTTTSSAFRGWIGCRIDAPAPGTFGISGPAGCARMDGTTNYFFKFSGLGALLGAATKVLLDDLVP